MQDQNRNRLTGEIGEAEADAQERDWSAYATVPPMAEVSEETSVPGPSSPISAAAREAEKNFFFFEFLIQKLQKILCPIIGSHSI